jgi:hypothetical protein
MRFFAGIILIVVGVYYLRQWQVFLSRDDLLRSFKGEEI